MLKTLHYPGSNGQTLHVQDQECTSHLGSSKSQNVTCISKGKTKCHTSMSLTLLFLSVLEKIILADKGVSWFNPHTQRHVFIFMYKMFSCLILLVPLAKALRVSFFFFFISFSFFIVLCCLGGLPNTHSLHFHSQYEMRRGIAEGEEGEYGKALEKGNSRKRLQL